MKKIISVFVTAILAVASLFALVACGGGEDKKPEGNNDPPAQEFVKDVHGRFRYTDAKGATYEFYIDSGNKFHVYGTLKHNDNTESYLEFEGQVTNMVVNEMYVECAQVMFFKYKYHGVEYDPTESGVKNATKTYKDTWADDHGSSEYKVYFTRTSNDVSDNGNAGTFRPEDGWDMAEGVWDFVPTTGQKTE